MQYSVETNNPFSTLSDNARVGNSDMDNMDNMDNPSKRKRYNTCNIINSSKFESMSQDNKLSAIFSKLSNIEAAQDEMRSMQARMSTTANRLERTIYHVDINTYKNQLLTYKYLDLETRHRDKNIIIYGLDERERDGIRIATVVRDFFSGQLGLEEDDLYLIYARRLGPIDNGRHRARKRPILCTFSHYSEVDLVMSETRRLRNTGYAIDRDYPPEIAAARKKLWPEVKQRRSAASSSDSIQLKFPAKIVENGRVVRDEFPHWQEALKSNLDVDFRFILQEDMLRASAGFPVPVQLHNDSAQNTLVPGQLSNMSSQNNGASAVSTSAYVNPNGVNPDGMIFRIPDIPPLPPSHALLLPSGIPQASRPTTCQLPRQPRPPSPYMVGQPNDNTANPIVTPNKTNDLQQSQLSPSLLSGYSRHNPVNSTNTNDVNMNTTTANTQVSSRSVSQNSSCTRDRSLSADKQGARGRPRNTSVNTKTGSRSRSCSVKSRSNSKGPVRNLSTSGNEHTGTGPGPGSAPTERVPNM